jgi:Flp pilus assembly protein TadG
MAPLERLRDRSGQSLIEFAIASSLFLLVLLGIMNFGIGIWRYNTVASLAQEGARWASVRGNGSKTGSATSANVQSFIQSRAPFSVTATATPAPSTLNPGQTVTVVVNYTFSPFTGLVPQLSFPIQATASMTMSR